MQVFGKRGKIYGNTFLGKDGTLLRALDDNCGGLDTCSGFHCFDDFTKDLSPVGSITVQAVVNGTTIGGGMSIRVEIDCQD